MYLIEKNADLGPDYLGKLLPLFQTQQLPKLNKWKKYYDGRHKILQKPDRDGKAVNRVVVNYAYDITKNYQGYITGVPITYENDDESFQKVLDVLNYNDVETEDSEFLKNALIYGVAYECNYIDEENEQRFRLFDSRECIPVYDNSLNNDLLYVVRFYKEDLLDKSSENYIVEVYGPNSVKTYRSSMGFVSFELVSDKPHFYGQCPITVFKTDDEVAIFNQIMSLQDGYNNLMSDIVDDEDSFADAYLVLKGLTADEEELAKMKQNRALIMDVDASAEFLTKNISDTRAIDTLQTFNDQIYHISGCPDFSDEKFMAQSGIALKYKILSFENMASTIEKQMRKALQRRLELISAIFSLTDDVTWQETEIHFTRNLPISLVPSTPEEVMTYKGLVSNKTLLDLLPFIKDANEEYEQYEAENSFDLYSDFNRERDIENDEGTDKYEREE